MKNYTKRYEQEDKLAKNDHKEPMLKMIHSDLSYRRHGSLKHSYDLMIQHCTSDEMRKRGLRLPASPETIISARGLINLLQYHRIPLAESNLQIDKAQTQAHKYLSKGIKDLFGSDRMNQLVAKRNLDEDRLDALEYDIQKELKDRLIPSNYYNGMNSITFDAKLVKALKHELNVLKQGAPSNLDTVLMFDNSATALIKQPSDSNLKVNQEFYHGLSQKKIQRITKQEHFMHQYNVHFRPALAKELNKVVANELGNYQQVM